MRAACRGGSTWIGRVLAALLLLPATANAQSEPLPKGALARFGTNHFRHGGPITALLFSADGKTLVSAGSGSDKVRLWDVTDGKEIHSFDVRVSEQRALALADNGKTLASADGSQVTLWSLPGKGERPRIVITPAYSPVLAAWPDGMVLAVGTRRGFNLLDLNRRGKELGAAGETDSAVAGLAFSPDGKTLAAYHAYSERLRGTGEVVLWDVAKQKELLRFGKPSRAARLAGNGGPVLSFAPDGKTLATVSSEQGTAVQIWDVTTGKHLAAIKDAGGARAVLYSPDGKLLAWSDDAGKVHLHDPAKDKELLTLEASAGPVDAVAFAPDGKTLATGSHGGVIRLWDPATGKESVPTPGHLRAVRAAVFAGNGDEVLTAGDDGTVRLWDRTGKETQRCGETGPGGCAATLTPDGRLAATAAVGAAPRLWDVATRKELPALTGETIAVRCLALSPNGKRLVAGDDRGGLRAWETTTGKSSTFTELHSAGIEALVFSPDNKMVASSSRDGRLRFWEVATGVALPPLGGIDPGPRRAAFSQDGRLLAWTEGRRVRLEDAGTGKQSDRFPFQKRLLLAGSPSALCFSPDHRVLAVATGTVIRLLELATGAERAVFQGHRSEVMSLTFSADGRRLLSGAADTTALLWDVVGPRPKPADNLDLSGLLDLFNDLKSNDAARAYRAGLALAAVPRDSVPFLNRRLHLALPLDTARLGKLLATLEDTEFKVQEKAAGELEEMGPAVVPHLRKALAGKLPLPVRRRLERVLEDVDDRAINGQRVVLWRALEVLERAATPQAREVLAKLAEGDPDSWLTREAGDSLQRLDQRLPRP
jgi:WD40 repeat protein